MPKILLTDDVRIDSIKPYPGNARRGDVAKIRESLRANGQYRPIVVQQSTGQILAGNHTWMAAKEEGFETISATFVECDDLEARKIVLADNKTNDNAGYDNQALAQLLAELEGDLEGTGFERRELDRLLDQLAGTGTADDASRIPPIPQVAKCEPGDIWALGPHRLICGDATDPEVYAQLLEDEQVALTVTSPPYNQEIDGFTVSGFIPKNSSWVDRMNNAYEDHRPEDEYRAEQLAVMELVRAHTTDNGALFYNHKVRYREKVVLHPLEWVTQSQWRVRQEIVWDRRNSITQNARMFMPCDERIYWLTKSEDFVFNDTPEVKAYSTVWEMTPKPEVSVSAPFPIDLPLRCLTGCSLRGDIVLDPYGGSGTTLIACEQMGRIARLIEVNPSYCDVIIGRWEAFTGMEAQPYDPEAVAA